MSRVRVLVGT